MWKDLKAFLFKGNVIDLAVAVVIGAAFGAIVNSLVKDVIMPVIGQLISGIDLAALKIVLEAASSIRRQRKLPHRRWPSTSVCLSTRSCSLSSSAR
jgi:large conductance mechanosensitive channel protein